MITRRGARQSYDAVIDLMMPPGSCDATGRVAPSWSRHEVLALAALLAFSGLIRLAACIALDSPLESDYLAYWIHANNIHQGLGLIDEEGAPTAFHSIGYPIFLSAVFYVFGASLAAIKTSNVVLALISLLLLYLSARQMFRSVLIALIATAFYGLYVEGIAYTTYVAKENLMILLLTAMLFLSVVPLENMWRLVASALGFGICAGCLAVVGNAGMAMMPGFLALLYFRAKGVPDFALYLVVACSCAAIVMMPVLLRNQAAFGAYVLNNNGGFNLYIGNNPNAVPQFRSITETPIGADWGRFRRDLGERGADVALRQMAIQHIRENPVGTLQLMFRKAVEFWWPPTHSGANRPGFVEQVFRKVWLLQFSGLMLLFVASVAWVRRWPVQISALWLAVLGYSAIHMIFYVVYRYRLPVMPFICLGAAIALAALAREVLTKRADRLVRD